MNKTYLFGEFEIAFEFSFLFGIGGYRENADHNKQQQNSHCALTFLCYCTDTVKTAQRCLGQSHVSLFSQNQTEEQTMLEHDNLPARETSDFWRDGATKHRHRVGGEHGKGELVWTAIDAKGVVKKNSNVDAIKYLYTDTRTFINPR